MAGLRREEVATLAGVSAEYYTRVERGSVTGVSESVLDGQHQPAGVGVLIDGGVIAAMQAAENAAAAPANTESA